MTTRQSPGLDKVGSLRHPLQRLQRMRVCPVSRTPQLVTPQRRAPSAVRCRFDGRDCDSSWRRGQGALTEEFDASNGERDTAIR
jgi:hypothetical protein